MNNLIKEVTVNNVNYIFNGKTLEIFEKENDIEYESYKQRDSKVDAPFYNNQKVACLYKLTLNMSNDCNLKCKYCYAHHGTYGREQAKMCCDTIDNIIEDLKKRNFDSVYVVSFFGGEPLMNYETIKYAILKFEENFKKVGNYEITTNSLLLKEEMIQFFHNINKVKLVLSVDGPEDITDYLRGKGVFQTVNKVLRYLDEINYYDYEVSATYTKAHLDMGYTFDDIINYFNNRHLKASVSKVSIDKCSNLYIDDTISVEQFRDIIKDDLISIYKKVPKIISPYLFRFLNSIVYGVKSYRFAMNSKRIILLRMIMMAHYIIVSDYGKIKSIWSIKN